MSETRELTDTEVESVCGGVYDLPAYVTNAVDNAISAAIGGTPLVAALVFILSRRTSTGSCLCKKCRCGPRETPSGPRRSAQEVARHGSGE
jgi:hypothetical protein